MKVLKSCKVFGNKMLRSYKRKRT